MQDYEKEKGKFEFLSEWERYLSDAETNGLNMFTILGFNNPLYHEGSNCIPKNDEIKSFEKYTKQLVNFLGERCGIYEVWNEPDLQLCLWPLGSLDLLWQWLWQQQLPGR